MTEPNERPQSGVTPPAKTPSAPSAPTGSVPIRRAPAPGTDRARWEQDRAAARQLGRGIRRANNGEGPARRTLPPEPPHDEDLGISAVTAEFSAAMVRHGAEERALDAAARAAAAEADDPTLATLMLDKEQLRKAAGAAGQTRPGAAERRSRWGWVMAPRRSEAAKAAPTRQPPAEQSAPPAPAAGTAQPAPAQPAAAPAAPAAAAEPATPAARSRREAEQALYQSVHDDHLFLNNPVLVRGLGLAPAIVAAVSSRTALLLCLAAALLITGTRVLAVAFCRAFGQRQRPLAYLGAAAVVYIPVYCLLYAVFGSELAVLGIYLPLLVADPVVVKRMEAPELETVNEAWTRGVNNALGQALALLLIGTLRELLGAGTVFGVTVLANAPLPLAGQPAGGFLLVGLLAAVWTAVGGAYVHYKREEVRMLYADRRQ